MGSMFGGGNDGQQRNDGQRRKAAKPTEGAADVNEEVEVEATDDGSAKLEKRKRGTSLGGGADTFGGGALG